MNMPIVKVTSISIAWIIGLLSTAGVSFAAEELPPLGWKHVGNTVEVHAHYYRAPDKTKRVVRIVHERLSLNRELTRDELVAAADYSWSKDEQGLWHMRPPETFQWRSSWAICWVLDGEVDAKLEEMTPLGVVYFSGDETCGSIFKHYSADILWHPAREQHLLLLGMSCSISLTVAIFPCFLWKARTWSRRTPETPSP